MAKLFAHILYTDSIDWRVFEVIRLSLETTTASSRIFLKILFQEMSENMGIRKLAERFNDEEMEMYYTGLFPKDHPKNVKFVINFFTSIGLGALTVSLRTFLKEQQQRAIEERMKQL